MPVFKETFLAISRHLSKNILKGAIYLFDGSLKYTKKQVKMHIVPFLSLDSSWTFSVGYIH
jgi:hypothetical protein